MRILLKVLTSFLIIAVLTASAPVAKPAKKVSAQELDYACIGDSLANYMNAVIEGTAAARAKNVRLLSPVFNMTSYTFDSIVNAMADNGARFNELNGVAGNAYNVSGQTITGYVNQAMSNPHISGLPLYLTEIGMIETERDGVPRPVAFQNLKSEVAKLKGDGRVQTSLLFNSFDTNKGGFSYNVMNDAEINDLCAGDCTASKIGINSAAYFHQGPDFYARAGNLPGSPGLRMNFTLEIARNDDTSVLVGLRQSNAAGLKPIVRIGVGGDSGGFDDPGDYADFINRISSQVDFEVWFIAGPNEPDLEDWAWKDCGSISSQNPNFTPGTIACTDVVTPEFHPLRPYPGNACDPLIPQSKPPAPNRELPDYRKYITYSCGNNLTPVIDEAFDPYGENGSYESLTVNDGFGNTYAHTICEKDGLHVTCYRSESINLSANLNSTNLGILGNTQDLALSDKQKVNEYLSYYLTGVPEISDHKVTTTQADVDRLINFAGPVRKLLPYQLQNIGARNTIAAEGGSNDNIHNYSVDRGNTGENRIASLVNQFNHELFQNIPLSSLEDTAGEFIMSIFQPGQTANNQQDPDVHEQYSKDGRLTVPTKIIVQNANVYAGSGGNVSSNPQGGGGQAISCSEPLKIMPLGDSITLGCHGPTTEVSPGGYRGPLRDLLENSGYIVDFVGGYSGTPCVQEVDGDLEHEGWGGYTTRQILLGQGPYPGINRALDNANPNYVLLHVGTNQLSSVQADPDLGITQPNPVDRNIEYLDKIIQEIHTHNPDIVIFLAQIIQIPALSYTNEYHVPEYNQKIAERFGGRDNIVIVPMYDAVDPATITDGVHPNSVGYETMARTWEQAIKETISCQ